MDWKTWSPFQSQTVKDICTHMTEDEKKAVSSYGAQFGMMAVSYTHLTLPTIYSV